MKRIKNMPQGFKLIFGLAVLSILVAVGTGHISYLSGGGYGMAIAGLFTTSNFTTDTAKKSYASFITRLMPNGSAPLFGMTSMLEDGDALQFEHGYFTKTMIFPGSQYTGAGIGAGILVMPNMTSTVGMLPGMLLYNQRTREIVSITSVDTANQVTIVRAVGTVAAAAVVTNDQWYGIGSGYEEASTRPSSQYILPVRITNYTQIFRNSWSLSKSAAATKMLVGDTNVAENRQDCAMFHAVDIEKGLFFGQKFLGTRNGQPFHTMGGLIDIVTNAVPGNVTTAGGTTNFTQLEAALDPCFNTATDPKVANERVLFVGGAAYRVLNAIGRLNGTYYLIDGQTSYGLRFKTLKTTRGTFQIIEHPLFNSNADWAKMAVSLDLTSFRMMWLRRTESMEYNMSGAPVDSGVDSVGGTLTSELTTEIRNPSANAIIYNLTAAAAG